MKLLTRTAFSLLLATCLPLWARAQNFLGFDRNDYPGDANMLILRKTFVFAGYWLNNPPGASHNGWQGHRAAMRAMGYGFLILFNGREYAQLKASGNAARAGTRDAAVALQAATREGFRKGSIIFLDQEQGGRMLPEQRAYIHAWIDAMVRGGYRAGIYCSGIPFSESSTVSVITAQDIHDHAGNRELHFFVSNDRCPPSPGCVSSQSVPNAQASGVTFADAWQFAQSPGRPEMTAACRRTYGRDGNCYPAGNSKSPGLPVDLDSANTSDPSHGRSE